MPRKYRNMKFEVLQGCLAVGFAAAVMLPGCGGQAEAQLDDYLEELEFHAPLELVKEVEIGIYRFSSAAYRQDASGSEVLPIWVQIHFKLYAEAVHEDESAILDACERRRGMLDDAVLTVFRKASIEELSDNRWTVLKSKLIDTIRPLLGGTQVRQIFFDDFGWEPI